MDFGLRLSHRSSAVTSPPAMCSDCHNHLWHVDHGKGSEAPDSAVPIQVWGPEAHDWARMVHDTFSFGAHRTAGCGDACNRRIRTLFSIRSARAFCSCIESHRYLVKCNYYGISIS